MAQSKLILPTIKNVLGNYIKISILLLFCTSNLTGQQNIKKELDCLISLGKKYYYREYDEKLDTKPILELIKYYEQGIEDRNQKGEIDRILGHYYYSLLDFPRHRVHLSRARQIFLEEHRWDEYVQTSKELAMALRQSGRENEIEKILLEAIEISQQKNLGHIILKPLQEITVHYSYDLNEPELAVKYGELFFKEVEKIKNSETEIDDNLDYSLTTDAHIVHLEMGHSLVKLDKFTKAKAHLDTTLTFFGKDDPEKSFRAYTHLISWATRSDQPHDTVQKYIDLQTKEYQKSNEKTKLRLQDINQEMSLELESVKQRELKVEKEEEKIKREGNRRRITTFVLICLLIITTFIIIIITRLNRTQKELNIKLSEEKDLLQSIDRDRNMHLSIIAHELRTPIFTAQGLMNLDTNQPVDLKPIKGAIDYLSDTIKNILSMPILKNQNANSLALNKEIFEPIKYVQELIDGYSFLSKQRRVKIKFYFDPHLKDFRVNGIKQNLGQVMSNLIHNAIKFSPQDEIIEVKITQNGTYTENKIQLLFSVKDRGIGISSEIKSKIFDYGVKNVSDSTKNTKNTEGLGIGLYVAQKILNAKNSQLNLLSEVGKGANFYFHFDFEIAQQKTPFNPINNTLDTSFNVLIIDDNKLNGLVAQKLVQNLNLTAYSCMDTDDFLKIIKEKSIELVITDINMPHINGFDATKMIKKNNSETIVIAHTAADDISMNDPRVIASGLDNIIIKPYSEIDLLEKIIEHMPQKYTCVAS